MKNIQIISDWGKYLHRWKESLAIDSFSWVAIRLSDSLGFNSISDRFLIFRIRRSVIRYSNCPIAEKNIIGRIWVV
jgi:hypothetical protein